MAVIGDKAAELRAAIRTRKLALANAQRDLTTLTYAYNRAADHNKGYYRAKLDSLKALVAESKDLLANAEAEYAELGEADRGCRQRVPANLRPTRDAWKTRACPRCGAAPGQSCRDMRPGSYSTRNAKPHPQRRAVA